MKAVTAEKLVASCQEAFSQGKPVLLAVTGVSMEPFLKEGRDQVMLYPAEKRLKKGDVALFLRQGNQPVLHRVWRVCEEGYFFLGDAQRLPEGPVPVEWTLAVVQSVCSKGRWRGKNSLYWNFFRFFSGGAPWVRKCFFAAYQKYKRVKSYLLHRQEL